MPQLLNIDKSYAEVICEIVLHGKFNPDTFSPLWMERNNLLGSKESEEINEKILNPGFERAFSTPFIDVRVSLDTFQIGIIDLRSINLQLDFVTGLISKTEASIGNYFNINLKFHFQNQDQKKQNTILDKTINIDKWQEVMENPDAIMTRIEENYRGTDYQIKKITSMSKCDRTDLKYPLHLNTYNIVSYNTNNTNIIAILTPDFMIDVLNDSIISTNKIIKTFF